MALLVAVLILAWGLFWLTNQPFFKYKTIQNLEINGDLIKKNETIAKLTAQVVKKDLEQILLVGSFYASRKEIVQLVQAGKWQEAANFSAAAFKENDGIDRIAFFDITGTSMGNVPLQSQLIGQNFSYRDWYRGVTANFKPYVSEVFVRATRPAFNVVGLSFPVIDGRGVPIGILLFTLKTDTFLKWLNELKFSESTLTFIVDQRGHVVAHPNIAPQEEIVDYSSRPEVRKAISGQSGTEITVNNTGTVSSFEPVPGYRWGVISKISISEAAKFGLIKGSGAQVEQGLFKRLFNGHSD